MKVKIRPFGIVNLIFIVLYIIGLLAVVGMFITAFIIRTNIFLYLIIIAVWPLYKILYQNYNRSIVVENNKIYFTIDHQMNGFFKLPKRVIEEFDLSQLKFYGVFTGIYILDAVKGKRGKKAHDEYDVIRVKQGVFKIPVGTLTIGNPMAFVFENESYVIDDSLFSDIQKETIFRAIEDQTKIAPAGAVDSANYNKANTASFFQSGKMVLAMIIGVVFAFSLPLIQGVFTGKPVQLFVYDYLQTTYVFMFVCAVVSIVVRMYARNSEKKDANFSETLGFITLVLIVLFLSISVVVFILSLFVD